MPETAEAIKDKPCPFNPEARCSKPNNITCAEIDCVIWRNIDGD
jgi:hypothetical protein